MAAPIAVFLNPDGSIHICGYFKVTLNPYLSIDQYPLPELDYLSFTLTGGEKFSKLDLSQAYL